MLRNKAISCRARITCIAVTLGILAACSREGQEPLRVSLRLPIPIIEAGSAPFFVAVDRGYYRTEGIDLDIRMGSPQLNPVKTVTAGTDTFGLLGGPDTLLVARSNGAPLQALMILHRNSNFPVLISLKSARVTSVEDLRNQRIGFYYGHISTDVLRNYLRKMRVPVQEVDVGFDYGQLVAGKIKAEWGFRTTAGLDLPAKGIEITMLNPADAGIVSQGYTIFATESTISSQSDMVQRFVRATLRGVRYTVDHPDYANAALLKRDPKLDPVLSLRRLRLYSDVASASSQYPPGYMDIQMFKETYDRLKEQGVIAHEFDVSTAFTRRFLDAAYASLGEELTQSHP